MGHVFINGKIIPEELALISTKERGFRFGDGIFETCRIKDRNLCNWDLHFARLKNGLKAIKINQDLKDLKDNAEELIKKNQCQNALLRISISRGIGSLGYLPSPNSKPLIVIETNPLPEKPQKPIKLWVSKITKPSLQSLPVNYKLSQGLNSTLAKIEAIENECFDSLLLNDLGEICETSSANIFWVKDDVLYTPDPDCSILLGTTRHRLINLSPIKVTITKSYLEDILVADEIFITNASYTILKIDEIKPNVIKLCEEKYYKIFSKLLS